MFFQAADLPVLPEAGLYLLILAVTIAAAGYILYRRWLSRRELELRLGELSQLAGLGRSILGARLDSSRLAELIYQQAGQIVDTTFFQLGLFEGERYRMLIWVTDGKARAPITVRLTPDSLGIVGWMRTSRQPLLVRDFAVEMERLPARPRYVSADPPRSAIFVPLLLGDQVLGGVSIQSRRPAAFSVEHLRLLSIIANTAAAAFQSARLYEQTERRAAQLQLLAEIGRRINVLQPLPAFYRQAVDLVGEYFGEYRVSVYTLAGQTLRLAASTRQDAHPPAGKVALGAGVVGSAAQGRRTVIVPPESPAEDDGAAEQPLAEGELAVPLQIDGQVLGVLHVQGALAPADEAGLSLFESLAAQIAFATLEAQVYAGEQRRSEQLAALAQASRSVVSTLDLTDLLDEVLDLLLERFGYRRARVFLAQDEQLVLRAGTPAPRQRPGQPPLAYRLDGPGLIALAGRSQQPVLVNDVTQHPDYVPGPELADTRAEMAAPLVMAGRLLGIIDVQSDQEAAYSQDDVQTLQTLADTLAVAVRNARLFEAERRRRRLADSLREISTALASTLSLDGVLDQILSGLARVVSFDVAAVLLVNEVGELCLRAARQAGPGREPVPLGQALDIPLFASEPAVPAVVDFRSIDQRRAYHGLFTLPEPYASVAGTLVLQAEHLGYLVVDRAGAAAFPPEEAELIGAFAAQAAVAIKNARLYSAQREQAWVSTALLHAAEAMARADSLEETLATAARMAPLLGGVTWCAALLAAEGGRFELRAFHHDGDAAPPDLAGGVQPADWPALGEMLSAQEPAVTAPDDLAPESLRPLLEGVAILLPLFVRGQVQGALVVGQEADAAGPAAFTAERIRLVGGLANQVSLALESALLDEAQQEEAWVNAALLQVAEALAGQATLAEALDTVVRLTPMLVGVKHVAIFGWLAATQRFSLQHQAGLAHSGAGLLAGAADLGVDPIVPDTSAAECVLPADLAEAFGGPTALRWALWSRQDLRGALVVGQTRALGRRASILDGIAHQLAMAMESAALAAEVAQQQRLEREMELGRDIQASFLPESCPQVPGWEVAVSWRSARMVGGDFYDFIRLRSPDGVERWGVAVADVSGKGVPAALFMALSRTLLRSAAMSRLSPAETLGRVNELILADARSHQFVTLFYCVWEPARGRVVYANAGHNPPVLVRAGDGPAGLLTDHGPALGVFPGAAYAESELTLDPGDSLLIYTDGLTDAVNAQKEEFGLDQVRHVAGAARSLSAAALVDTLVQTADWHAGGVEAFDDMTLVALQRTRAAG